jgi:hypothetical protein
MAKYGSDDVTVNVDNSGGTPVALTNYIDTISGIDVEAITQETHAFGDAWVENSYVGVKKGNAITMEGFYDDTASTGPDVVFGAAALGDTRTVTVLYGASKSTSFECVVQKYVRTPTRGELTRFSVTLLPTGTSTEV